MAWAAGRILLVEDDALVRRATARVLRDAGARDEAESVTEAKSLLSRHHYDRGIFDVHLPDGDGMELLEWARARGWRGSALVMTGETDRMLPARALLLGAQLVYKPTPAAALRAFAAPASPSAQAPASVAGASLRDAVSELARERRLSSRQTALVVRYAHGASRRGLAAELSVRENTIKTMVRQILEKTEQASLDELLRHLLRRTAGAKLEQPD